MINPETPMRQLAVRLVTFVRSVPLKLWLIYQGRARASGFNVAHYQISDRSNASGIFAPYL
jgi:hypothetical protein